MPKHKPAPLTKTQQLAHQIIDSAIEIQLSDRWQHVEAQTVGIQRAARQLLQGAHLPELQGDGSGAGESLEVAIASGYLKAAERQIEGAAEMITRLTGTDLCRPETISLCVLMLNIATATMHKYLRAARAVGDHAPRPLDIDGEQGGLDIEEAA